MKALVIKKGNGSVASEPVGPASRFGGIPRPVDHRDAITVDLVHPDHPIGAEANGGGQPGAVCGHSSRVVTDMVAEVEGVERRHRDAARAGGGHPPDANAHTTSI